MNWRKFFGRTTRLDMLAIILGLVFVVVYYLWVMP